MEANPMYHQQYQASPQLEYVGIGRRFGALVIDFILAGIISSLLVAIFHLSNSVNQGAVAGTSLNAFVTFVYYVILEATLGATLGKKLLGIRVVKTDGTPIGWSESIIRNLLRIIDGLFLYLVAAILVRTSPLKQRLGDRAAHTVVIRS